MTSTEPKSQRMLKLPFKTGEDILIAASIEKELVDKNHTILKRWLFNEIIHIEYI